MILELKLPAQRSSSGQQRNEVDACLSTKELCHWLLHELLIEQTPAMGMLAKHLPFSLCWFNLFGLICRSIVIST